MSNRTTTGCRRTARIYWDGPWATLPSISWVPRRTRKLPQYSRMIVSWRMRVLTTCTGLMVDQLFGSGEQESRNELSSTRSEPLLSTLLVLWESLYEPSRKRLRATLTLARENLKVVSEYTNWITPGGAGSVSEIEPGTGTRRWVETGQGGVSCESMWSIRNGTAPYCENPTRPWRIRLENSGLSSAAFAAELM
jgi:hypothetical protein